MKTAEGTVAVLVDCDNTRPEILEEAVRVAETLGRVVIRRGYGNTTTLGTKWQKALVQLSVAPCLQLQYASGKNTADIALAIDAVELMLDKRADTFVFVTSDSDFVGLSRKLRERGARVAIVGESKTPEPLRTACDQFVEFKTDEAPQEAPKAAAPAPAAKKASAPVKMHASPMVHNKQFPQFVVDAVELLAEAFDGKKACMGHLGNYLRKIKPDFSPKKYGHASISVLLSGYPQLEVFKENGGHWVRTAKLKSAS